MSVRPLHDVDVLVVDDNPAVLESTAEVLEAVGLSVAVAENGLVALEVLSEVRPALIVLDLSMPLLDGMSFAARLASEVRIVVMSAHGPYHVVIDSLGGELVDYLIKPVDPPVLVRAVTAALGPPTEPNEPLPRPMTDG